MPAPGKFRIEGNFLLFVVFKYFLPPPSRPTSVQERSQFGSGHILCHNHTAAVNQIILKAAFQVVRPEYFRIGTICFYIAVSLCQSILLYRCIKNRCIAVKRNRNQLYLAVFICQMCQCSIFSLDAAS